MTAFTAALTRLFTCNFLKIEEQKAQEEQKQEQVQAQDKNENVEIAEQNEIDDQQY